MWLKLADTDAWLKHLCISVFFIVSQPDQLNLRQYNYLKSNLCPSLQNCKKKKRKSSQMQELQHAGLRSFHTAGTEPRVGIIQSSFFLQGSRCLSSTLFSLKGSFPLLSGTESRSYIFIFF